MRFDFRAEFLFFLGTLFFTFSLFHLSGVLSSMLELLKKPKFLSSFPLISSAFLLLAAIIHFYKLIFVYPKLSVAGFELFDILYFSFKVTFLENALFLLSGIFAFLSAFIYLYWVSR